MHALNDLRESGKTGKFELFIDRPPCEHCSASLAVALAELDEQGIKVKVRYLETTTNDEGEEKTRWKTYKGC